MRWFLGRSGVIAPEVEGRYTFEEWLRDVRNCGMSDEWWGRVWREYHARTAAPHQEKILWMGERAYKQMLFIAQVWGRHFYSPLVEAEDGH